MNEGMGPTENGGMGPTEPLHERRNGSNGATTRTKERVQRSHYVNKGMGPMEPLHERRNGSNGATT